MRALSHSSNGNPARRAASLAVARASGRMSLTLQGRPNFMLTPTSEVESLRVLSTLVEPARVNSGLRQGPVLRPRTDFLPVAVNKSLTFGVNRAFCVDLLPTLLQRPNDSNRSCTSNQ